MEFKEWVRGPIVGRGSFATVNLIIPKTLPRFSPSMVVKSTLMSRSDSLKLEKQVFSSLGDCSEIVRFLGDCISYENGNCMYSLCFEYAQLGNLQDYLRKLGGKFNECDVRKYTKSILKGISYIHDKGFVHCDIKLSNVLLFQDGNVKISDFGVSSRINEERQYQFKGTPLYMSPELVSGGDIGPAVDVWALGCAVVYMFSGNSPWKNSSKNDVSGFIFGLGMGKICPEVPKGICCEGRDFISKCFIKDPKERWIARMLLDHPFVNGFDGEDVDVSVSGSPRDPFEFSSLLDEVGFSSLECLSLDSLNDGSSFELRKDYRRFACERVVELDCGVIPEWYNLDEWVNVR